MDSKKIWDESLQIIKKEVGASIFELWFEPVKLRGMDDGTVTLDIPNRFFKEWIEDYHPGLLSKTIERVSGKPFDVKFKVSDKEPKEVKKAEAKLESRKTRLAKKGIHLNLDIVHDVFL